MELRVSEIKSLEPDFENGVIYGTLKTGKKFKLNVSVDKIEKIYTKLKNKIYGKFREEKEGIPRKPSTRKLYTNLETGETLTAKEFSEKYNCNKRNFQQSVARYGKFKGVKFTVSIIKRKEEKIKCSSYSYVRIRDKKEMSLKEICNYYDLKVNSARTLLRIYGEVKTEKFEVYKNGSKIEVKKNKKIKIYKNIETGIIGTLTDLSEKLSIERKASFISMVSKVKKYKNYHFELQGEC